MKNLGSTVYELIPQKLEQFPKLTTREVMELIAKDYPQSEMNKYYNVFSSVMRKLYKEGIVGNTAVVTKGGNLTYYRRKCKISGNESKTWEKINPVNKKLLMCYDPQEEAEKKADKDLLADPALKNALIVIKFLEEQGIPVEIRKSILNDIIFNLEYRQGKINWNYLVSKANAYTAGLNHE